MGYLMLPLKFDYMINEAWYNILQENCAEETQKKLKATFAKMSVLLPDPSKSEDCFQRLNRMKNNSIFNALEELLGQLTTKGGQNAKVRRLHIILLTFVRSFLDII